MCQNTHGIINNFSQYDVSPVSLPIIKKEFHYRLISLIQKYSSQY